MKNNGEAAELRTEIATLKSTISELEALVRFYEEQFRLSKKRQFGASSEKSEYDQLSLDAPQEPRDDDAPHENEKEPDLAFIKEHYRKKRTRKDGLPEDLAVEEVLVELPESERFCPDCGETMRVVGHEHRDELVVIPEKVMIRRFTTCTYACRQCAQSSDHVPMRKSIMPACVIKGSFASPESIAYAACRKFVMGIPLYRQEQEWKRQGVLLSRQTMSNWLIRSTQTWLLPLYEELKHRLSLRQVLHADETTFQVLKEPGKRAQSKSYLWIYRTSGDTQEPLVVAEYKPDRGGHNPADFLADFSGYLHTDGFRGYHNLPSRIVVVGCWAHVRRNWNDALQALKDINKESRQSSMEWKGKRYCDALFAMEREWAGLDADERHRRRQQRLKPLMNEFFSWAAHVPARPKSLLGKAISYMFSEKIYLQNVLLDPRLELSNNRAERTVKPFVISGKNFLFANTQRGANAAAILFSFIETAKESGVNPFEYLTYVFKMAPAMNLDDPQQRLTLFPLAYKKLNQSEVP